MANLQTILDNYKLNNPNNLCKYGKICGNYRPTRYTATSTILMEAVNLKLQTDNVHLLIDEYLQENPEEINRTDERGKTALMYIFYNNISYDCNKILDVLICAGANLNIQDNTGMTALMFACHYVFIYDHDHDHKMNRSENIMKLINSGADINIKNNDGMNALEIYCNSYGNNYHHHAIFKLFMEKNVMVDHIKDDKIIYHIDHVKNLNKIKMQKEKIKQLKLELKLVPDSPYVKSLGEHFNNLAKN